MSGALDWSVLAALLLLIGASAAVPPSRRRALRIGVRVARRVGLPLRAAVLDRVVTRTLRSRRAAAAGALAGIGLAAVLVPHPLDRESLPLAYAAAAVGFGVGRSAAMLSRVRRAAGTRVARSRAVDLRDYVPPIDQVVAWAGATCSALVGLLALQQGRGAALGAVAAGVAVLGVGGAVLLEAGGRWVADLPQPSADPDDLAWDDALRSLDLRELAVAPGGIGAFAALALCWPFAAGGGTPIGALAIASGVLCALGLVWSLLAAERSDRHFLRRLWPDRALALVEAAS